MKKKVIKLSSPEGNAFYLLGTARKLCKELNLDEKTVCTEMMDSDYDHLIVTFKKHFGKHVTLKK